jgi:hypothetical protein
MIRRTIALLASVALVTIASTAYAPPQAPAPRQTPTDSVRDTVPRPTRATRADTDSLSRIVRDSIAREASQRRAWREKLGGWGALAGIVLFGVATLWCLFLLVGALSGGEVVEMETHWGGLGGGLGGWKLSRPLSQLLAVVVLASESRSAPRRRSAAA